MARPLKRMKILNCVCLWLTLMPLASHLEAKVTKSEFGNMPDGTKVEIYTLEEGAIKARVMTYGARLVSLEVPDRNGKVADIVLGYESLAGYTADPKSYFGSIVGRYGNRIAHATFTLDGKRYQLPGQRRCQHPARGNQRLRQAVMARERNSPWSRAHPGQQGWRSGLSGTLTARVRYTLEAACAQDRVLCHHR